MTRDITLNNNCSIMLSNICFNVIKNNMYNYNKIWGKSYSLNDIKSVAFRTTGFIVRFSDIDCISIDYDEFERYQQLQ